MVGRYEILKKKEKKYKIAIDFTAFIVGCLVYERSEKIRKSHQESRISTSAEVRYMLDSIDTIV